MKTKDKTIVPRNRFARLAAARCSGSHSKPYKTERRHTKVADRKGASDMHNYDHMGVQLRRSEHRTFNPGVLGSIPSAPTTVVILKYIFPWMRGIVVGCVGSVSVFQYDNGSIA